MNTRVALAALLAPAMLLTACGGGTSVADPPVFSPSASSSAPPPPKRETPEEFIRRFTAVSNALEMGGDATAFLDLTRRCSTCNKLARQITEARTHGGFYRSRGWTLQRVRPFVHGDAGAVDVDVRSAPTAFKMSSTAPVRHYTGGLLSFRLAIRRWSSGWRVTHVLQLPR
jgi:hypothetical protein